MIALEYFPLCIPEIELIMQSLRNCIWYSMKLHWDILCSVAMIRNSNHHEPSNFFSSRTMKESDSNSRILSTLWDKDKRGNKKVGSRSRLKEWMLKYPSSTCNYNNYKRVIWNLLNLHIVCSFSSSLSFSKTIPSCFLIMTPFIHSIQQLFNFSTFLIKSKYML